jgi:hypothetical protein
MTWYLVIADVWWAFSLNARNPKRTYCIGVTLRQKRLDMIHMKCVPYLKNKPNFTFEFEEPSVIKAIRTLGV